MVIGRAGRVLLTAGLLGLSPSVSFAYQTGFHFYSTYVTAIHCGLSDDEAYTFAWANYSVDRHEETNAGLSPDQWLDSDKVEDRRLFHFPVLREGDDVERGSAEATRLLRDSLLAINEGVTDPVRFGIALHAYQDSWAHEGYGHRFGHAWTFEPDYPEYDPDKAFAMIEATWLEMNEWSKRTRQGARCLRKFSEIAGLLRTWLAIPMEDASATTRHWRRYSRSITGRDVTPFDRDRDLRQKYRFLANAQSIKNRYGSYRQSFETLGGESHGGAPLGELSSSAKEPAPPPVECP